MAKFKIKIDQDKNTLISQVTITAVDLDIKVFIHALKCMFETDAQSAKHETHQSDKGPVTKIQFQTKHWQNVQILRQWITDYYFNMKAPEKQN